MRQRVGTYKIECLNIPYIRMEKYSDLSNKQYNFYMSI